MLLLLVSLGTLEIINVLDPFVWMRFVCLLACLFVV